MQGVIKAFDPVTGLGSLLREPDAFEIDFSAEALSGGAGDTEFRFLRQGQRVNFTLDDSGQATALHFGSEQDMQTPLTDPNVAADPSAPPA